MRTAMFLLCAIAANLVFGQIAVGPAPSFEPGRVLPSGSDHPLPLAPGMLMSIYGEHLGPVDGCEGVASWQADNTSEYPSVLCETQVLVGGIAAGVLYVQERQINFKLSPSARLQLPVEIQAIYKTQASRTVTLRVTLEPVATLESPAKAGMPVWLKVSPSGWGDAFRYPFDIRPAGFGCLDVEVRRNGIPLPRSADFRSQVLGGTIIGIGNPCGSLGLPAESHHNGRIPLHLQYRFDSPGTYEVRYTIERFGGDVLFRSDWTSIEILPGTPTQRSQWLQEVKAHAPDDTVELLTDFLPSLLGVPDRESLDLLCGYLYHPDSLVREYAMYGLMYWPRDQADSAVRQALRATGPSDAIVRFLSFAPDQSAKNSDPIVESAIPALQSDSPVIVRGAVEDVYFIALKEGSLVNDSLRTRAVAALIDANEHVLRVGDAQTVNDYACALGSSRDGRAGPVLWDLVNREIHAEQAVIALTWLHAPADLPKLGRLMQFASLPHALRRGYGDAAIPYLETMLEQSEVTAVRTESACQLMPAGRPSGFDFVVDAVENARPYRAEMLDFLRGQFPELRQADDAALLTFLRQRSSFHGGGVPRLVQR